MLRFGKSGRQCTERTCKSILRIRAMAQNNIVRNSEHRKLANLLDLILREVSCGLPLAPQVPQAGPMVELRHLITNINFTGKNNQQYG